MIIKNYTQIGIITLLVLCLSFFIGSYLINSDFPIKLIVGEDSPGTWLSGGMLIICMTLSLVLFITKRSTDWIILVVFFFALAIDERFMIHEFIKYELQSIIEDSAHIPKVVCELPVMFASIIGVFISVLLWVKSNKVSKTLLIGAVVCGTISVVLDIINLNIIIEESFKLIAEFLITSSLLCHIQQED
jgi:hypothetical protein